MEGWKAQGWEPRCQNEAFYKPNEEGLYVSYNMWQAEQSLIYRTPGVVWTMNDELYLELELPGLPSTFLAECLASLDRCDRARWIVATALCQWSQQSPR